VGFMKDENNKQTNNMNPEISTNVLGTKVIITFCEKNNNKLRETITDIIDFSLRDKIENIILNLD